jgi:hypothetical protein
MPVQPSDTMHGIYQLAQPNWQRMREQQAIGMLVGGLTEIPGADGEQMGWGILGLSALLNNVVDQIRAGLKTSAFAAQAETGLQTGVLLGSAVGCGLIAHDELHGRDRLQLPPELATHRPVAVTNAESAIKDFMGSPAFAEDLLNNARDQGRWAGRGMVTQLAEELPGLDFGQAGVALLTCGSFLLNQGARIGYNEATRGFLRTRRKVAEGMTFAATGLAGAVMVLVGDACLERSLERF